MAVHVDYLQPEHELRDKNVIPALHSHVLVDMRQSVTDAGCLRAFESICASRRDSFNVRFLLLGIHETLLFAGGIVLGAKDPARQLKNLLEMVGTVSPMLAHCACVSIHASDTQTRRQSAKDIAIWYGLALEVISAISPGEAEARTMYGAGALYTQFVRPYASAMHGCMVDQDEQAYRFKHMQATVSPFACFQVYSSKSSPITSLNQ